MGEIDINGLQFSEADIEEGDTIPGSDADDSGGEEDEDPGNEPEWTDDFSDDEQEMEDYPEKLPLILPSTIRRDANVSDDFKKLAAVELELRTGQANDCLEGLRLALGHKALLFRTRVQQAATNKQRTRAWDDVKTAKRQVEKYVRGYHRARGAMKCLAAGPEILSWYKMIKRKDLKLSGDVTEANRLGQRNDKLAWFWTTGWTSNDNNLWMDECMFYGCFH